MTIENLVVAIFAGGQSQRMGQDKANLTVENESLLERTARLALQVASRVIVVGREKPQKWPFSGVEFLLDDEPGLGPLGALQTVLCCEIEVLVLACDLPRLNEGALHWLAAQTKGEHGIVVNNNGQWEPLVAIYRNACLPLIEENLAQGRRSMHALIKRGNFAIVAAPPEISKQLVNVNTPEEWAAVRP